ncbi:hypothetical protein [Streptomyces sp. NPDC058644]|uniref:hypothetical protein n=1 Tax=unclassified Streptomyces TaxID=2593676 RepID=UPI00364EAEF8
MPAEVNIPIHVRAGDTERCWGTVSVALVNGVLDETALRHNVAEFLRESADVLESPSEDDEEVPDASAER